MYCVLCLLFFTVPRSRRSFTKKFPRLNLENRNTNLIFSTLRPSHFNCFLLALCCKGRSLSLTMAYMAMSLHAVNHRLTNIPVKQLPPLASCLAASLSNCGELLSTPQSQKSKSDADNAVQVHKLMTRVASLLQDRSVEGRWTAVVLVKALVEAGQWEVLRGCEPFVRGLIGILNVRSPLPESMLLWSLTALLLSSSRNPILFPRRKWPSSP